MRAILMVPVLAALISCGQSDTQSVEACRLPALQLDYNESEINSTSESLAVYEVSLPRACIQYLGSTQQHVEMIEVKNDNRGFRLQSFELGKNLWNVEWLEINKAQFLTANLFDGIYQSPRDLSKDEAEMAREKSLLDSTQLPLELSSDVILKVKGGVLGLPTESIEVNLQASAK